MNAAQQSLSFRLANAPVGRWRLTVPGDVEIKGGADVVSREVDEAANVTRFELLPRGGDYDDPHVAQQPLPAPRAGRGLRAASFSTK